MNMLLFLLVALALNPRTDTVRTDRGVYIGQMPSGAGKFYDEERGLYVGNFDRAVPSGRGIHFRRDGGRYAGNFVRGTYSGYGRLFTSTGAVVCGTFTDGHANGRDTLFYPDGKVFIGIVQNNGPTQYGKTYRNAQAARVEKPSFPEVYLTGEDKAFLNSIRNGEYDTPAVFKDGVSFFQAYIAPNFHYSESMSEKWAVVRYEFVVGADGRISDVTILSTTDEEYAEQLVKVIRRSPRWHPALKDGKPVPYTVKNQKATFNMPQ